MDNIDSVDSVDGPVQSNVNTEVLGFYRVASKMTVLTAF